MAASLKLSELTALTAVDDADLLLVTDSSATQSKKVTFANLKTSLTSGLSVDDLRSAVGTTLGSGHMGTFTGSLINDNTSVKAALQALETATELRATTASPAFTGNLITHIGAATAPVVHRIQGGFPDVILRTNGDDVDLNQNEGRLLWEDAGGGAVGAIKMTMLPAAPMRFFTKNITAAEEKMRITTDGRVGIGKTIPLAKLHVAGTVIVEADFPDFDLRSNGERRIIFQDAGGGAEAAIKSNGANLDIFVGGVGASNEIVSFDADSVDFKQTIVAEDGITLGGANITAWSDLKDDIDLDHIHDLTGVSAGTGHLGTFTGSTIADSTTIKAALQALETSTETKFASAGGTLTGNFAVGKSFPDITLKAGDERRILFSDAGGSAEAAIKSAGSNMDIFVGGVASGNEIISIDADSVDFKQTIVAEDGLTLDSVAITTIQTSGESFADNDTSLMTSAAIDDRISSAGGATEFSGVTAGTVTASKGVLVDSNKDITGFRNVTLTGELDSATLDVSGDADIDGTTNLDAVDIDGDVDLAGDLTFSAAKDIQLVDNNAAALEIAEAGNNYVVFDTTDNAERVELLKDVTLESERLYFTHTAPLIRLPDNKAAALTIENHDGSAGEFVVFTTSNSGLALTTKQAHQHNNTLTVGEDDTGYDVKLFGATASAYLLWDESADDLILAGAAGLVVPDGQFTLGSTAVTSTAAELNILDGVTSTAAELNILDGVTATTAELNILDGVTSTAAELNILDGVTATTAELNILDGVTSTAAELNILDGVTATTAEVNVLDGATAGTAVASKAVVLDSNKDITGIRNFTITGNLSVQGTTTTVDTVTMEAANAIVFEGATADDHETTLTIVDPNADRTIKLPNQSGCLPVLAADSTTAITATPEELNVLDGITATVAELNILDGVTSTAAELNILDGVTSTAAELNILDGVTSTAAELNILDGVTATTAELNILDGVTSTAAEINVLDGVTAGTVSASKAVVVDSNKDITGFRNLTLTGWLIAPILDISGNVDIDGITNLDAVDIDGATQIDATVTVGVDDTGYDVKFFGATSGAYMLWDESEDDLVLAGAAGLDIAGDIDVDGTTNLDAVDIDGATQIDGTVTVGVDDTGYDVKFFGASASAYMLWDESADDLILAGAAGLVVPDGQFTLGSTAVTSTAAELNILDGVTSTAAELNILDGVTSTTAELNILDGVTSTAAELNILDGVTSTAAELNILDGVTATTAELNILDGVTSTAAELNVLDGLNRGHIIVGNASNQPTSLAEGSEGQYLAIDSNGDAVWAAVSSSDFTGVTAGTVTASKGVKVDSNKDITGFRHVTLTGELDAASLDISGDADIDGTTNLDAVDIDGATQIDATVTVGVDDTGYDVKFFGATSGAYMLWDESEDDLVLAGAAGLDIAGDIDVDGTANLDNVDIDGNTNMAGNLTFSGGATNMVLTDNTSGAMDIKEGTTSYMKFDTTNGSELITVAKDTNFTGAVKLGGTAITSTAAELNILDGVTSTAAELNILDGVTATTAELNILDGVTATTAELNILDGVTSTAAELNILDGVTSTAAELNLLDGATDTTWTATLEGSTGNPGSKVTATGQYARMGKMVIATVHFNSVDTSSYSGDISISGLPVTSKDTATAMFMGNVYNNGMISGATDSIQALVADNGTTISFLENANGSALAWGTVGAGKSMRVQVVYISA